MNAAGDWMPAQEAEPGSPHAAVQPGPNSLEKLESAVSDGLGSAGAGH